MKAVNEMKPKNNSAQTKDVSLRFSSQLVEQMESHCHALAEPLPEWMTSNIVLRLKSLEDDMPEEWALAEWKTQYHKHKDFQAQNASDRKALVATLPYTAYQRAQRLSKHFECSIEALLERELIGCADDFTCALQSSLAILENGLSPCFDGADNERPYNLNVHLSASEYRRFAYLACAHERPIAEYAKAAMRLAADNELRALTPHIEDERRLFRNVKHEAATIC